MFFTALLALHNASPSGLETSIEKSYDHTKECKNEINKSTLILHIFGSWLSDIQALNHNFAAQCFLYDPTYAI